MSRTSVRLPDDLEAAARKKCRRLDVTLSHVIRQYLEKWARETDSAMYVYIQSEPGLFTVGFYAPDGRWHTDDDFVDRDEARRRVHYLNGGNVLVTVEQKQKQEASNDRYSSERPQSARCSIKYVSQPHQ